MPEFFHFTPGIETSRAARQQAAADASPLLGRFRAVPRRDPHQHARRPPNLHRNPNSRSSKTDDAATSARLGALAAGGRGSVHVGYGALVAAGLDDYGDDYGDDDEDDDLSDDSDEDDDNDDIIGGPPGARRGATLSTRGRRRRGCFRRFLRRSARNLRDLWIVPRQGAVKRLVEPWWRRWAVLVILPAALAVAWCALPFPQYPLADTHPGDHSDKTNPAKDHRAPGHGEARVQVNFWFFLFVYYGFYNLTALIWITKVFNLYSLNWWPSKLGFPLTISLIAIISIAGPIPVFFIPEATFLTIHNTAWISWTFIIMAMPVAIAFGILMTHERHLSLRHSLSDTQRIFTSSWWTGEAADSLSARENRRRMGLRTDPFDPDAALNVTEPRLSGVGRGRAPGFSQRRRWLPASFVRFIWFCLALTISLFAYLIGEAYAEIYLRTLPHNNFETIVYVYSWVVTVHLLDMLTGWILGASEGERVGSYPLSWVFKLYFMLTYQTYVRSLYARLRKPSQFILLQALSSGFLIVLTPLQMTQTFHTALTMLGLTTQSYASYQKICTRNVFIRSLAENVSMLAFLGSVLVLHYGPNKDVYPYFAFDELPYDLGFTFYASMITWACELAAAIILRVLIRYCFGVNPGLEGKTDLAVWPELLPTSVAVMLHVLQNMLFSIVRLQFRS